MKVSSTVVLAAVALTMGFSHSLQAAENSATQQLDQVVATEKACMERAQSNVGMKECSNTAFEAADAILNQVYSQQVTELKKAGDKDSQEILRRLVASERAWITFRDADCSYKGTTMLGGSGESLQISECAVEKTISRARDLATF